MTTPDFPYFFVWRGNPRHLAWFGRRVRIVVAGARRRVLIEDDVSRERMVTFAGALRKIRRRGP